MIMSLDARSRLRQTWQLTIVATAGSYKISFPDDLSGSHDYFVSDREKRNQLKE